MLLALGLAPGMGISEGADDGSLLTNMHAQNNNRRRLPRKAAAGRRDPAAAAGADDLRRFIGSLSMSVPVDLAVGRRIALSSVPRLASAGWLLRRARAALARPGRLQPVGRRARRPAAGAAGERGPGGAAHGGRQRGVQRPARSHRVCRAPAARLGHDREDPLHRRRLRAEGPAAVHDRPAAVRGRGGAGAVAARRHQGARRAGAERARARPGACSIRRRSRARSSTS